MWSVAIYYVVLFITVAVAIRRGGPLERWAAYTALIASVLTSAVTPFPTWTDIEFNIFVIDMLVLLSFWLIAIFGHIQKFMFSEILARPYSLLSVYISYPILLLIIYASGSSSRRNDVAA